ncbi:hypothetical protein EJ05DRAFT_483318 [Pseudovirgaria hyperparasitica]|uniref:Uncharacterized protein n=1 Tax=Pseudovirgaria hyperparasitica TaxID=470096 RepID=A0A6A6WFS9_9PEZI|nr:uncharacterized protein EJ05DRAFT_483318 [Pseudovirgaria hyperparasitica]KAF2760880.1 hypothetical protein EJ05DRAFT_483318 [Pseudovirgaria hyperparasitica]
MSLITPKELVAHIEAFTKNQAGLRDVPKLCSCLYSASTVLNRGIEQTADILARVTCIQTFVETEDHTGQPTEHADVDVAWHLKLFPLLESQSLPWKPYEPAQVTRVDRLHFGGSQRSGHSGRKPIIPAGCILIGLIVHGAVKEESANQFALKPSFA